MKLNGQQIKEAIEQLITEYKYDPVQVLDIMKMGLKTAYKKDYLSHERKAQIDVTVGGDGGINLYRSWDVVDEVEEKEEDRQLLVGNAQLKVSEAKSNDIAYWVNGKETEEIGIGDTVTIEITPDPLEFTRIGVQAAAQTIKQNLKSIERERFFEKFQDKQGELLKAKVLRVIAESVVLDVDGATVVLPSQ